MLATAGFTSHLSVTEDQWVRKQSQTKQSPPVAKRGDAWLDGECKLFRLMTDFFFRVQLAKISSYLCLRAFLQKENEMQGRFFNCALSHIIMYLRHPMTATKHPSHAHTHTHTHTQSEVTRSTVRDCRPIHPSAGCVITPLSVHHLKWSW